MPLDFDRVPLQIAIALALGMIGQIAARHLRIPGIVVLLALGVVAGPDGLGVVRPAVLGHGLVDLVGFVVAVILFEGSLALDLSALRRQATAVRRLVTWGALVTAIGGTLVGHFVLGWDLRVALLFGTLVVVTGPTVINPLLRRLRIEPRVGTVLEGEGILGDAIGATAAVVALEAILAPRGATWSGLASGLFGRLAVGVAFGVAAALVLAAALRFRRLVPDDTRNVFVLAILLGATQTSEAVHAESGILTAIVAGLAVGNLRLRSLGPLREFKEELTSLFLGLLFVLLAADVRISGIAGLGARGLIAVALMMVVVRPLNVLVGTAGSGLGWREKSFLAWMAPRGIVAAAVASHFADVLGNRGIPGGGELRAMVFLLIATTVTVQGLTGGWLASALGLRRPRPEGWVVLGGNRLALALARRLADRGPVLILDSNPERCRRARAEGFEAASGNALDERHLERAGVGRFRVAIGLTTNEEVNFLFARRLLEDFRLPEAWVALDADNASIRPEMLEQIDARVLFGGERRADLWEHRFEVGAVEVRVVEAADQAARPSVGGALPAGAVLPLLLESQGRLTPYPADYRPRPGDRLHLALARERVDAVLTALAEQQWHSLPTADDRADQAG
jgi:NhaP-type Na+/H+ or K+/H+ antiporter